MIWGRALQQSESVAALDEGQCTLSENSQGHIFLCNLLGSLLWYFTKQSESEMGSGSPILCKGMWGALHCQEVPRDRTAAQPERDGGGGRGERGGKDFCCPEAACSFLVNVTREDVGFLYFSVI